jgi:hypothetical protein
VKFPKGFLVGANGVTNIGSFLPKDAKVADWGQLVIPKYWIILLLGVI